MSRWLVLLGCAWILLVPGPMAAGAEDPRDATLLAYYDVWNSGRLGRLEQLVTEDFQRHGGPSESCTSRDELKQLIAQSRKIFKHLRFSIDDHMSEERGGAVRGSFYGVHNEIDRVVEFELMTMVRFEDGLIAEEWILGNNFLALVGLGYQLTPPGFEVVQPTTEPMSEAAGAPSEEPR